MGLTMIGTRSGMMIFPLVITAGIWLGGLREAFLLMALLVIVIGVAPPLIMRRRPEDVGLRPDGERLRASVARSDASTLLSSDPDWTVREAIRTRAFWLLLFGTTMLMAVGGAVNFTFVSHMTQNGIDADTARSALALWAGMGIVGGVLGGELPSTSRRALLAAAGHPGHHERAGLVCPDRQRLDGVRLRGLARIGVRRTTAAQPDFVSPTTSAATRWAASVRSRLLRSC